MKKSIYEEALEIMIDNILPREGGKVNKTKVIKALLQAQKQEKLLELYRKHYKLVPFMPGLGDNAKTVIDNSRKIEQIEKELEK